MSNPIQRFMDWVWRTPKSKISERLRNKCEAMPHKQRLTVVGLLFGILTLTAFLLFGHACYKIGAREERTKIEIKHIESIDFCLPTMDETKKDVLIDSTIKQDKCSDYDITTAEGEG